MTRYLVRRLLQSIPLVFAISLLSFALLSKSPGGLVGAYGRGRVLTLAQMRALEAAMGVDRPWYVQYWHWLGRVVRGDLGHSFRLGQPVLEVIAERIPATVELVAAAVVLAALIALPLGLIAARRSGSPLDNFIAFGSFAGYSMPVFVLGYVLMFVFSIKFIDWFGWGLPSAGQATVGIVPSLPDYLSHLMLPALTLAVPLAAGWSRFVRSSVTENMRADFVRTARAKGLSERDVMRRHVLRASLIPVVTQVAIDVPLLFGGTIVTEKVWSWPGLGQLLITSLQRRDLPVAQGLLVLIAFLVIAGNLAADMVYAALDPRIRYE
ncbi:MAG: ABC transporter permease [Actinobacteria bacterium]|nr:MAG: ABC transporter permease [Actinomycetota bacterium]